MKIIKKTKNITPDEAFAVDIISGIIAGGILTCTGLERVELMTLEGATPDTSLLELICKGGRRKAERYFINISINSSMATIREFCEWHFRGTCQGYMVLRTEDIEE